MWIGGTGPLDQQLYRALYGGRDPTIVAIARMLTFLGEPWVVIALAASAALGLSAVGRSRDGLTILLVTLVGRALSILQKYEIHRARPDLESHLVAVKTSSFPSGHTTASMIFYLSLATVLARGSPGHRAWAIAAVAFAMAIGLSRVVLGVHWPSDVVGGWCFGLFWVLVAMRGAEWLSAPKPRP